MTNEQIAAKFLSRFPATEADILELAAILDTAEEEGATKECDKFEKTSPGVAFLEWDLMASAEDPFEKTQPGDMTPMIEICRNFEEMSQ